MENGMLVVSILPYGIPPANLAAALAASGV